jgi:signal transduction histidine kinase
VITPGSLSFRLLAGAFFWILAALAVGGFALSEIFRAHSEAQVAQRLESELNLLAAQLRVETDGTVSLGEGLAQSHYHKPYSGYYWQVADSDGVALLRSRSLWDKVLPLPADKLLDGTIHRHLMPGPDGERVIAYERAIRPATADLWFRLTVAENEAFLEASLARFRRVLLLSLSVLGAGLVVAAVAQVILGLRPLRRLRRQLAAVRAGREERLGDDFPEEIAPLVRELNGVLDQNAEIVARARTQAGNLAHALKTPLAVLTNEAGVLEDRGSEDAASRLRRQIELMRNQIDIQLARARAAASTHLPGVRTDVAPQAEALARTLGQVYRDRNVDIAVKVPEGLAFHGERQDLDEMLGNIMENACKWASRQVRVTAQSDGSSLVIAVEDDGPGLPVERRVEVFARGRRLDESTAGSGLGLSITKNLAEIYGGDVTLGSASLGGLRVELKLPLAIGN